MSFCVIADEPRRKVRHAQLALGRMQPGPSPFCLGKLGPPTPPSVDPDKDPGEELADRERPVTGDDEDADLLRGHPSEWLRPRCHVNDPFRLAEPEREHLLE